VTSSASGLSVPVASAPATPACSPACPTWRSSASPTPMPPSADRVAGLHGARSSPDAESLVRTTRPDALYVCVPPFTYGEAEAVAVEHGLALFVEKLLAADLPTAERIGDAIAAAGLVTATGYHWRCLDTVQRARALLDDRPAGLVAARWIDKVPPPAWWPTWTGSGGQMIEQVTHRIDLVRHLGGEVESVVAHGTALGHCGPGATSTRRRWRSSASPVARWRPSRRRASGPTSRPPGSTSSLPGSASS
jgi:myo-inositol 2-dehydrogenase / D-chiro-inositol 1-dehydrogenase